ncbi:MAG: GTP-binding protein [Chloroflexi bacterium]|nr:MAG: GTP-binding protein [Chloroflexota bacterium]
MLDRVKVNIAGGDGGNGSISFRREKFVPRGGPDGGNGGIGGSVYAVATGNVTTLEWFRQRRHIKAERGQHGRAKNQSGAGGKDVYIDVPVGTLVYDMDGKQLGDLVEEGEVLKVAAGGVPGKGNREFATPTNRIPLLAEHGEHGERLDVILEVKLIADVGIVGKPNAGKSTLLAHISRAKVEAAPYPFTTKEPVLGVVLVGYDAFVAVEIPGLLEGAHEGVGLGHDFLRHIERTRVVLHLVDGMEEDPVEALRQVRYEMEEFNPDLAKKPYYIAINKLDIPEVRERQLEVKQAMQAASGRPVTFISAASGEGVEALVKALYGHLSELNQNQKPVQRTVLAKKERKSQDVEVVRRGETFMVSAPAAERLLTLPNFEDWRARLQLQSELAKMGVLEALEGAGIKIGDTVILASYEFEWE